MRRTLKEWMKKYERITKIQIVAGVHLINIDTECKGSWFIIRAFENEKFYCMSNGNGLLVLNINE